MVFTVPGLLGCGVKYPSELKREGGAGARASCLEVKKVKKSSGVVRASFAESEPEGRRMPMPQIATGIGELAGVEVAGVVIVVQGELVRGVVSPSGE